MSVGERLRQARQEAGLSQRQLCGDMITRNMLSLIENGAARPSMDTLIYLADRLGRPISYFLEETVAVSTNVACMENARASYARGEFAEAMRTLSGYHSPDAVFDDEFGLLKTLILLSQAEAAQDRPIHARQLLEEARLAMESTCYATPELEQRRRLLLSQVSQEPVILPVDDRPLSYRAEIALKAGNAKRCITLLEACEERESANWHYLRAEAAFCLEDYALAAEHYRLAERERSKDCWPKLEQCYRAMNNYKLAYEYACKQR